MAVSGFGLKNKLATDFGCAMKSTKIEGGAGSVLRSSGLLRVEASRAGVFQSSLKTGGDVA
jgi:hypothetical protein